MTTIASVYVGDLAFCAHQQLTTAGSLTASQSDTASFVTARSTSNSSQLSIPTHPPPEVSIPVRFLVRASHAQVLRMHPIFVHTRLQRAPIVYDVMFTPSARTVLDRTTQSAISSYTLNEFATDPPTPSSSRLVLRSPKLPWPVIVGFSTPHNSMSPSNRVIRAIEKTITNLDVLYAVHTTLLRSVTPGEWEALGHGSRAQQKVTKAYEARCIRMDGGWEGGVKRIDWLGSKLRLIGIKVDQSTGPPSACKLIFGKA